MSNALVEYNHTICVDTKSKRLLDFLMWHNFDSQLQKKLSHDLTFSWQKYLTWASKIGHTVQTQIPNHFDPLQVLKNTPYLNHKWVKHLSTHQPELFSFSNTSVCSKESRVSSELEWVRSVSSSRCFCRFLTFQWRHSASESNQSEIWSWAHMLGTG